MVEGVLRLGREGGGERTERYSIACWVVVEAAMRWFATSWSRELRILRFCGLLRFSLAFSVKTRV